MELTRKTHTGPQAENVIPKGVFDNVGSVGKIRASALKQYGLLEVGDTGYNASELAKQIGAAPGEEKAPLLRKACLAPAIFKTLYDTFQSSTVVKAKIRQQALNLKVHPDAVDSCVDFFVGSLETARLATVQDDRITILAVRDGETGSQSKEADADQSSDQPLGNAGTQAGAQDNSSGAEEDSDLPPSGVRPRATIQVNVTLDSSLDTDKLERQLKLLRKYGAI